MTFTQCISVFLALTVSLSVGAVDDKTCAQDRERFLASIEKERETELAQIERSLRDISDNFDKDQLRYRREQIWDAEELMRATAEQIWRDCTRYVQSLK